MKALTLHQPWASLVALGVKRIETRSWSTTYRGPLAIHAAKKAAPLDWEAGGWAIARAWSPVLGERDLLYRGAGYDIERDAIPRGVVIATCTLIDVVPIEGLHRVINAPAGERAVLPYVCDTVHLGGALCLATHANVPAGEDIEDQRPFGDFTPGRFAWLLEDIQPIEPVPARGRQQLWEWAA